MGSKREWRKPTDEDRFRKCRARSPYEKRPFYVEWNDEWGCWAIAGRPHILVAVTEVLSPARATRTTQPADTNATP